MRATKIGMVTESELKQMNKRKMAHETPDRRVKMVSHKKSTGYVTMKLTDKDDGVELMNRETSGQLAIKTPESVYPSLDEVDI